MNVRFHAGFERAEALLDRRAEELTSPDPGPGGGSGRGPGSPGAGRARPVSRLVLATAWAGLVAFVAFLSVLPDGLPNGDAAVYAQQISARQFSDRPVHMGYYVLGAVATGWRADFSDWAMNAVSAGFAAATVALVVWLTGFATGRPLLGLAAGSALLGHWTFVQNAVWAEVYAPQTFFVVLSAWSFWRARVAVSAGALALAVLITPSSLFAVPALVAGRPQWRKVLALGTVGGGLTLLAIAGVWNEYFFGSRGLFEASSKGLSVARRIVKEGFEGLYGVGAFLPFLLLGLWRAGRQRPYRPFLLAVGATWATTFVLGERFADVPVQLPTWVLVTPLLALGLGEWGSVLEGVDGRRRVLALGAFFAAAVLPYVAMPMVRREADAFAALPAGFELLASSIVLAGVLLAGLLPSPRGPRDGSGPLDSTAVRSVVVSPPGIPSLDVPAPGRRAAVLWVACLVTGLFLTTGLVRVENRAIDGYRSAVLELEKTASEDFLAVGKWSRGILFEHYLYRASYTGRWINLGWLRGDWGEEEMESSQAMLGEALDGGQEIWLLGASSSVEERLGRAGYSRLGAIDVPGEEPLRRFGRAGALPSTATEVTAEVGAPPGSASDSPASPSTSPDPDRTAMMGDSR